jgi:hypothetical protein
MSGKWISTLPMGNTNAAPGIAPCVAKQVTRPVRNREAPVADRA